ncbi:MAG: glycosyltransferase family 4 protein [Deltaproteobacteria bacterium]|nr:glycosyltransferase family 4 protein [Deltaproteobacteria bacterium]
MKILVSVDNYDHGTGGAEKSVRALAQGLAARGHEVCTLQHDRERETRMDGEVRVESHPLSRARFVRDGDRDALRWNDEWSAIVERQLTEHPADLVLTQQRLLYSSVAAARARGVPVVVFVRAYSMFCPRQFRDRDPLRDCTLDCRECLSWRHRIAGGPMRRNLAAYRQGLRDATLVVANSHYMQQVISKLLGLESAVVHPFTSVEGIEVPKEPGDCVLFVKPQYVKGLPIVAQVARRMPETHFLVAGHARRRARRDLGSLPNVELAGWQSDMRAAYARARVLIGPSIWPEPFGRVFVEAGAAGVPSIGSARGGIPEAIGDGGMLVDDVFDVDAWVRAIRRFEDPQMRANLSARARAHAMRFAVPETVQQFVDALQVSTGLAL